MAGTWRNIRQLFTSASFHAVYSTTGLALQGGSELDERNAIQPGVIVATKMT